MLMDRDGEAAHAPVMLEEMVMARGVDRNGLYVDATFGAGGYAAAILDSADCRVWGIDQDPDAVSHAAALRS